jgi:hypothetical protein
VEVGKNLLSRLIVRLFGFPTTGRGVPVEVRFMEKENGELWQRTFAGKPFSSFQSEGSGRSERLLTEKFGPVIFDFALVVEAGRLSLVTRRWKVLGIPMPLSLSPNKNTFEDAPHGDFNFHVEASMPVIGLIVRYQGSLRVQE